MTRRRSSGKAATTRGPEPDTTFVDYWRRFAAVLLTTTKYSWFHIIFVLGAMYVAMLLTDWWVQQSRRPNFPNLCGVGTWSRRSPAILTKMCTSEGQRLPCGCALYLVGCACCFICGV